MFSKWKADNKFTTFFNSPWDGAWQVYWRSAMSFVQSAISSNNSRFYYVKGITETGSNAWYFINVQPAKDPAFKKIDYSKPYNLADYGEIINSGFGEKAPKLVLDEINAKYKTQFSNN